MSKMEIDEREYIALLDSCIYMKDQIKKLNEAIKEKQLTIDALLLRYCSDQLSESQILRIEKYIKESQ